MLDVRLSVMCNVVVPYSEHWEHRTFRQYLCSR